MEMTGSKSEVERVNNATNHYEVLGLEMNSTAEEIRKAFLKCSKQVHPDKHSGGSPDEINAAKEAFQKLNQAVNTLKDQALKEAYDATLLYTEPLAASVEPERDISDKSQAEAEVQTPNPSKGSIISLYRDIFSELKEKGELEGYKSLKDGVSFNNIQEFEDLISKAAAAKAKDDGKLNLEVSLPHGSKDDILMRARNAFNAAEEQGIKPENFTLKINGKEQNYADVMAATEKHNHGGPTKKDTHVSKDQIVNLAKKSEIGQGKERP
jgi:curved DNA-binding protein